MFFNYIKFAIRGLRKRRLFSFINVFGLSVGIAVCLVILKYVTFELSYDRHHTNGSRIYRTILTRYLNGEFRDVTGLTGYGTGPALLADVSGIKRVARTHEMFGGAVVSSTNAGDPKQFREDRAYLVDPSFLQMFTFKSLAGDLSRALDGPNNVVITRSLANKYYGGLDALNKSLRITSGWTDRDFIITAIIEDQAHNSSLKFDFLLPINDLLADRQYVEDNGWGWKNFTTFIELHPDTDIDQLMAGMPEFLSKYVREKQEISFQSLYDIHLQPGLAFDSSDRVSRDKIYFYLLIAAFILFIAWINYVNLATARAIERAREVGIKKVIGAQKKQLILQFLLESALVNVIAIAFSILLAMFLLPVLGDIVGKPLAFDFTDVRFWMFLGALAISGTILSGIYPVFVLSSFKITTVLKGGANRVSNTFPLRKLLVVFQFACSLILISMTFVVHRQLLFMEKQVQGLNMDQMLIVKAPYILERDGGEQRLQTFKHQVQELSFVESVCSSAGIPGSGYTFTTIMRKAGDASENQKNGNVIWVDPDFFSTYNMEMLSGNVWNDAAVAGKKSVIINETALTTFEIKNAGEALGHQIILENDTFAITGVTKDYYWNSLKTASVPLLFSPMSVVKHTFSIRLKTENYSEAVSQIESLFKHAFPGNPVEYFFLDAHFDQQYKSDRNFGRIFTLFAILAVLISSLGLLGLTAFTTDKRLREISIRKVLGASRKNIISMLSRDFLGLVMLATSLAIPVMWYATNNWLNSFANRMALSLDIFIGPVLVLTAICLITMSTHIVRGAASNPADVLKSE